MSDVRFEIDGREVTAGEGVTVLTAARKHGIEIPTICYLDELEPFGGCRLCIVEVEERGWSKLVVSCVFPVADGIIVRTRSEKIDRIRKVILELLLSHAPHSRQLLELAEQYGAQPARFASDATFCIHCGLCVRYCHEVKKLDAVGFIDRGYNKQIAFIPELATQECAECKECFPLCPTSYLQAAYVLIEGLAPAR